MKYIVNGKTANVKTFVKYCCMELPVPNGYYRLLRALLNCHQDDPDYQVLEEWIAKYEEKAVSLNIKL